MNSVNQSLLPITAKIDEAGILHIGGCSTVDLAEKFGTPLYVYDEESIRNCCRQYKQAFAKYPKTNILFAAKAFMTSAICRIMHQEGLGLDLVSGGEIYTAVKTGFPMERTFLNGNNKSAEELEFALKAGVGRIDVDNFSEMELLDKVAKSINMKADVLLRITPGIECHTHDYIKTGHEDTKFGFDLSQLDEAVRLIKEKYLNINLVGLHAHIGSQIFETTGYIDLVGVLVDKLAEIREKFGITLTEMNMGGGLGIKYLESDDPPSIDELAEAVLGALDENLKKYNYPEPILYLEPGRSIVGTSGVTLYKAGSVKVVPEVRKYVSVDGGMADNPRPALYGAQYSAVIANKANQERTEKVTISGRFCESGDIVIRDITLPEIEFGDIICVFDTGAYNYTMSFNYNRVGRPAAVLVKDGKAEIIIRRETWEDLTACDVIPESLALPKAESKCAGCCACMG
ncbi:MAG: diaminopimelate decarboxylase [Firmicutes bacterium]|nr:diaminopimelate decarboxylase [Bacillota bacterium]